MINRERLRQADKHARRRWRAFNPANHRMADRNIYVDLEGWQKYRKVTAPCSRPGCCGNPRRVYGERTRQELRAELEAV